MRRGIIQSLAGIGAAALLLSACTSEDGSNGDGNGNGNDTGSGDSAAEGIQSWDACEVLNDLQPIVDYMELTWSAVRVQGQNDSTPL